MFALPRLLANPRIRKSLTRVGLALLALCALWFATNAPSLRELYQARQTRENELQQLRVAGKRVAELRKQRDLLTTSDFETEKRIREELRMVKPDERVIYVRPD